MKFSAVFVCCAILLSLKAAPAEADLLPKVVNASTYTTLVSLLDLTNLTSTLSAALTSGTKVTVFAPDNAAFAKLDNATVTCLTTTTGGSDLLKTILLYHVAVGSVPSPVDGQILTTLSPYNLTIATNGSGIFVSGEKVTAPLVVEDTQGVVHGVSNILIPPGGGALLASTCSGGAPAPKAAPTPTTAPTQPVTAPAPAPSAAASRLFSTNTGLLAVLVAAVGLLM